MTKKISKNKSHKVSPEEYVEFVLINLEKANKLQKAFHKNYHTYLNTERNNRKEEIITSLKIAGKQTFKGLLYRVVLSNYMQDPLCLYGSLLHSGRFNFGGNISPDYPDFSCLYVSSSLYGAQCEKFPNEDSNNLLSNEKSLAPNNSFLISRCQVLLKKCIDIRTPDNLKKFTKIISEINPTAGLRRYWRKINQKIKKKVEPLNTIKSTKQLHQSLLEKNYKQWETYVDLPSNSQWFGSYVKEAGIEAIIYPSIKDKKSYNLAIYPCNLKTGSYIRLKDKHSSVSPDRIEINGKNHKLFECEDIPYMTSH